MLKEITIGGLHLKTFGILFALAFLAVGLILHRRLRELDRPPDWAYEITFAALIGGLIGSRLYFVIQNYDTVKSNLLGSLFGGSGLVWYGGLIGGALGVIVWAWRRRMLSLALLDLCAVPLAAGYAIGRIGCQVSGDGDYGVRSSVPWAMSYPDGEVPTTHRVHPTPVYEAIIMGLVAWWLWRHRDAYRPGILFAIYLCFAGLERFVVEFIRRNSDVFLGLTAAQLESIGLFLIGVGWLLLAGRRDKLRLAVVTSPRPART